MYQNPLELIPPIGLGDELRPDAEVTCARGIITTSTSSDTSGNFCDTGTVTA